MAFMTTHCNSQQHTKRVGARKVLNNFMSRLYSEQAGPKYHSNDREQTIIRDIRFN
jgi:hypothetical protein